MEESAMKRTIHILTAIGLLAAPALAQKPTLDRGSTPAERAERARLAVAREVRHELLTLPYYGVFDWLEYDVRADGTVVLRGQVTRPTTKSSAENVVEDVEGVGTVRNEIEVLPLSPSDDRLRLALYRAVYSGPLFRYQVGALNTIHIIVSRGHVTLKGQVDTQGDRNIAYIRANGVPGTFSVKNELRVTNRRD
jgi:hyperosmotically inducible protein